MSVKVEKVQRVILSNDWNENISEDDIADLNHQLRELGSNIIVSVNQHSDGYELTFEIDESE